MLKPPKPCVGVRVGWTGSVLNSGRTLGQPRSVALVPTFPGTRATGVASALLLRVTSLVPARPSSVRKHWPNSVPNTLAAAPVDLASLDNARPGAVLEFDAEAVAQAIRSFKHGSAPGPSGLRADHLREALLTPHADEVAAHLAELCQVLARGEAPDALAPHLAGGSLHARGRPTHCCW